MHSSSNLGTDLRQSRALGIKMSIALSMLFTKKITVLSNLPGVFDKESDELAKQSCKVFITAVLSILERRHWESCDLSTVYKVYCNRIG